MEKDEKQEIYDEFYEHVNMAPSEIERWLKTGKSKSVGQDSGAGESIGRKSGKKIIEIERTKKSELKKSDYEHMQKVNAYITRHSAQRPDGEGILRRAIGGTQPSPHQKV